MSEENLNKTRCPKCFSILGTWINDPILTRTGSKFVYDENSGLLVPETNIQKRKYKGFIRIKAEIIIEIQDIRKQQEIDVGITEENRTKFSKVQSDSKGYWVVNKKHIKELRDSIEKILAISAQTKEEYFNYDEEGTERQSSHQLDWIDLNLTKTNFRGTIKDSHIEDLRKAIGGIYNWSQTSTGHWSEEDMEVYPPDGVVWFSTSPQDPNPLLGRQKPHLWQIFPGLP